jgi:hypothetical protein
MFVFYLCLTSIALASEMGPDDSDILGDQMRTNKGDGILGEGQEDQL